MNVKVLGLGGVNCRRLERRASTAVEALLGEIPSLEAAIKQVTDEEEIAGYAILDTPGLVIDEQVICSGRVPQIDGIAGWLREELAGSDEAEA